MKSQGKTWFQAKKDLMQIKISDFKERFGATKNWIRERFGPKRDFSQKEHLGQKRMGGWRKKDLRQKRFWEKKDLEKTRPTLISRMRDLQIDLE